ncbi:MAG: polysaccharide biosynthesis protein [Lachnospiraceae bacterium]|nr:polysaccharide biosynthesis protein [Lachnospiraceae bacterium]
MKILIERNQLLLKKLGLALFDMFAVVVSSLLALVLRFEGNYSAIPREYIDRSLQYISIVMVVTLIIFYVLRLYGSLWSYAGATEFMNIIIASILSSGVQMAVIVLMDMKMPRSYYVFYGMCLFGMVAVSRYSYRVLRTVAKRQKDSQNRTNVLIMGAGGAGNMLVREITNSSHVNKRVVCIVDDAKAKQGSYLHGVKIMGTREDIPRLVKKYHVDEIMLAIPSAPAREIKKILDICKETGCELKRLPGIYQLVNGEVSVNTLKEVEVNDLLGREPVEVDLSAILDYVAGKTVLVTGGGGSIGSEICRQVAEHNPRRLVIVDIYENTTYDIQNELKNKYPYLDLSVLIASVRNTKRMDMIFEKYRPDIVYHAAAHKHVPLMEDSPNEAVKNNVLGTWKVVQAADRWKTKRFVMISTDKAVNPTNIMGATKRICEMIVQTYNNRSQTEFVSVRFGNVLGSNGSVIPLFKKQIAQGGPVTVTHPDIIRYFMTIPEAVSLVLQAGVYARGGEIFVLDMGEPVKIVDLARNLILLSGHKPDEDIPIVFTGLRPGEKLYEEMLMKEEGLRDTENKLIHIGMPIKIDEKKFLMQLENLASYVVQEPEDIRKWVQEIVPTYHPMLGGKG